MLAGRQFSNSSFTVVWRAPGWLQVQKVGEELREVAGSPARPASPSALSTIWLSHCDSATTIKAPRDPCSSILRGFVCWFLFCFVFIRRHSPSTFPGQDDFKDFVFTVLSCQHILSPPAPVPCEARSGGKVKGDALF